METNKPKEKQKKERTNINVSNTIYAELTRKMEISNAKKPELLLNTYATQKAGMQEDDLKVSLAVGTLKKAFQEIMSQKIGNELKLEMF